MQMRIKYNIIRVELPDGKENKCFNTIQRRII